MYGAWVVPFIVVIDAHVVAGLQGFRIFGSPLY